MTPSWNSSTRKITVEVHNRFLENQFKTFFETKY